MLKSYKSTYEIWDVDTNEVLVDNLSFEDAVEQSAIYEQFFGEGVCVAIRESCKVYIPKTPSQEYKTAWINYFAELQAMGNLN